MYEVNCRFKKVQHAPNTVQHAPLLVAGQLPFGLPNIWEVAFPQVDVQDFH